MIKRFYRDKLVSIQVYYHMPDHVHLIQEFIWQTEDIVPDFPRSVKFIRYWHKNIDAVIQEAYLYHTNYWGGTDYINLKDVYEA